MQHIELKAKLQTVSGNAVFSLAFITQREISVHSLLSCMSVLDTFPANNALKKWGSSKKCSFPTKHPLQPKKLLSFTSWWLLLSLSNVCFFQKDFFLKVGFFSRKCVIYNVYCVLKRNIPLFFLYHGNIPSGRCCFLQGLNTWLKVGIIFKQFSLSNRNWQYCVKTCCVL